MRNVFIDMKGFLNIYGDLLKLKKEKPLSDRITKSRKIEDKIYTEVAQDDTEYKALLENGKERLSLTSELARDVFQCFYSLNPAYYPKEKLSIKAQNESAPIIDKLLQSDNYPSIKNICEGKGLQALSAACDFLKNVLENADGINNKLKGDNKTADALQSQSDILQNKISQLEELYKKHKAEPNAQNEKKLLNAANNAVQKKHQVNALKAMADDNKARAAKIIGSAIDSAMGSALDEAQTINAIISSWGNNSAEETDFKANRELIEKVRQNKKLLEIAKYLGPYKEMLYAKRKNAFAYGRGEKYSIEYGNNISSVIGSEFSLLADSATLPLFLRKYQNKQLKQYKKRDKSDKALGDIIVCLDESSSMQADNKDEWSKAIACVLAEAAVSRGSNAAFIHFSSSANCKTDIITPQSYSPKMMMDYMTSFLRGGTNYETPLKKAVKLLEKKQIQNADIVFITDGECRISEEFAAWFSQRKSAMHFTVTGVLLDNEGSFEFSLRPFCNEVYRTSTLDRDMVAVNLLQ